MALNPNIPLGVRPVEIPNAINAMSQVAALQNQMRMVRAAEEEQRVQSEGRARQERVRNLFAMRRNNPDFLNQLYATDPATAAAYEKSTAESGERQLKVAAAKLDMYQKLLPGINTPEQLAEWYKAQAADPDLRNTPVAAHSIEQKLSQIPSDPAAFIQYRDKVAMGLGKWLEVNAPKVIASGSDLVTPQGQMLHSNAPSPTGEMAQYEQAKREGFRGGILNFRREIAAAGRAPGQPRAEPAPTVTQVVDPTNPARMLSVDARQYQGGGPGSPGVIGVAGKEPAAAARENKVAAGSQQLIDEVEQLRGAYMNLDRDAAIPSNQRGAVANVMASIGASGVGQIAGRAVGTKAQTERDVISSARIRLLNAIKNATGMSAQQLNSNVELQTWLRAVTDPNQSIETVNRILDSIVESYGKPRGMTPGASPPPKPNMPPPPPGFQPD
jgi:hypothetical protein